MSSLTNVVFLMFFTCNLHLDLIASQDYGECFTPNRQRGSCVELQKCQYLYNILVNSNLSQSDRTFLARSQCGYINNKVLVCCPPHQRVVEQPTVTNYPIDAANTKKGILPSPPHCGTGLSNRIFGGNITGIDEFPWMALLEYTKNNVKGYHCGGSLINDRYVLTAGHCVKEATLNGWRLTGVRLGEWDIRMNPDCEVDSRGVRDCVPEHLDLDIEEVIPHPQYNPRARNQMHDIALLRLPRSVEVDYHIKPICLPNTESLRNDAFTNIAMDVAGWGATEYSPSSSVKLKATVTVQSLDDCRKVYRSKNVNLGLHQMCAGGSNGIDSCRGDSGGPLMVQQTVSHWSVYYVIGVVSIGPRDCGMQGVPGVYTKVGSYIDWITNTIRA